ncbi:unnamed protein product [Cochlearia groenlandica]
MEEKLVINELEQGRELAKRLMNNLKHTSSIESSKTLLSEILHIYQNAIFMLSFNGDDKNILKRSHAINEKDSRIVSKKRKITEEKKTEKVSVFVGTGQEKGLIDDGFLWRKYGQKEIHGSTNPRGYFRCTHRFTQSCLAVKQVQKSDKDPSIYEVKYLGDHTCINNTTTNTSKKCSVFEEEENRAVTEQSQENKPKKTEEVTISLEDIESKKSVFRTFSFSNYEIENNVCDWESNIFLQDLVEKLSPTTTTTTIGSVDYGYGYNLGTADSYFSSSLDNINDFGQDWLWS